MAQPIRLDPRVHRHAEIVTPDGVVTVTVGDRGTSVIVYRGLDGAEEVATVRLRRERA